MSWYVDKGRNAMKNVLRMEERMKRGLIVEDEEMKGLIRGKQTGNDQQKPGQPSGKLSVAGSVRQQEHLSAMVSIAKFIVDSGMIVATQLPKRIK